MTIAISIKVNDGIVLASDSAATLIGRRPDGRAEVFNIYDNADKIFNLRKGLPIGMITWGSGGIGTSSISTLAKDFRKMITEGDKEIKINPDNYTIEEVIKKVKNFFYDEKYISSFKDWKKEERPFIGFMVTGYSSGEAFAEEWRMEIRNGDCTKPVMVRPKEKTGISWNGEIEPIHRLYFGFSTRLGDILKQNGLDEDKIKKIFQDCRTKLTMPMVVPAMPIQDAIDLAKFLVYSTIQYLKFGPGAQTVGGPIEVVAITKHEHFKWVQRKHYYDVKYNLEL